MPHARSNSFIPKTLEDLFDPDRVPIPVSELTAHYIFHSPDPALGLPHILRLLSPHPDEPLLSVDMKVNIKLVPVSSNHEPNVYCLEEKEGPIPAEYETSDIIGWIIGVRRLRADVTQFVVAGTQGDRLVVAMLDTPANRIDSDKCPRLSYYFWYNKTWYGNFLDSHTMYARVTNVYPDMESTDVWGEELPNRSELNQFVSDFRQRLWDLKWTPTWYPKS